jgi:hypothetical protein
MDKAPTETKSDIDAVTLPKAVRVVKCKACGLLHRSDNKQRVQFRKEYVEALLRGMKAPTKDIGTNGRSLVSLGLAREARQYTEEQVEANETDKVKFLDTAMQQIKDNQPEKARDSLRKMLYMESAISMRSRRVYLISKNGLAIARTFVR